MQNWPQLDKIFIASAEVLHTTNYGPVTKEWILENNPPYIETRLICPLSNIDQGQSIIWEKVIRYYRDGTMEVKYPYNASRPAVNGKPIISPLGYKIAMQHQFIIKPRENGECRDDKCNCIDDQS